MWPSVCVSTSSEYISKEVLNEVDEKYGYFAKNRFLSLEKLIDNLQNKSEIEIIEKVNNFFNDLSYSSDKDTYGVGDYWATPFEFLARNEGDCEDYVIAKYFLLKYLGISPEKMYITYVNVEGYTQAHMVLTYYQNKGSEPWILDSFKKDLLKASKRIDLKPIYYFNPEILKDGQKTSAHRKWDELIKNITENKL